MGLIFCVSFFPASDFTDHFFKGQKSLIFVALKASSHALRHMRQPICYTPVIKSLELHIINNILICVKTPFITMIINNNLRR